MRAINLISAASVARPGPGIGDYARASARWLAAWRAETAMRSTPAASTMTPPASRPAPIQGSVRTEAATLIRTATGREPSAFMATTVQLPLRSGQVRTWVPGPATWAAQIGPAGHGRGSAAAVHGVGGVVVGDAADGVVACLGQVVAGSSSRGDPGEHRASAWRRCDADPYGAEQRPRHRQATGRPVRIRRAADHGVAGAVVTPGAQTDVTAVPLGRAGPQGHTARAQEPERAQDQHHAHDGGDDPGLALTHPCVGRRPRNDGS